MRVCRGSSGGGGGGSPHKGRKNGSSLVEKGTSQIWYQRNRLDAENLKMYTTDIFRGGGACQTPQKGPQNGPSLVERGTSRIWYQMNRLDVQILKMLTTDISVGGCPRQTPLNMDPSTRLIQQECSKSFTLTGH